MDLATTNPDRSCKNSLDEEKTYFTLICNLDVLSLQISFIWIILVTILLFMTTVVPWLWAKYKREDYKRFRWFKESIFYQIFRGSESSPNILKSTYMQYFLYASISLGYFYWIPIQIVLDSIIFEQTEKESSLLWDSIASIVGLTTEFFYFWITFFVILLLGTRWEYTKYYRLEHVSSSDKVPMLTFILKKSVIMSLLFSLVRLLLFALFRKPLITTYNHPVSNTAAFRIYRIFRASYIFSYAFQRLMRYHSTLGKLKLRRNNEVLEHECMFLALKHQKEMISSTENFELILRNSPLNPQNLVESVETNVREYFESQKEELELKIKVVKEQKVNTLHRNPKQIRYCGGIYLLIIAVIHLVYAICYSANELCQGFNPTNYCNCTQSRHAVETVRFLLLTVVDMPISFIIQWLLAYDSLFNDTVELD